MKKLTIGLSLLLANLQVFADFNKTYQVSHQDITNGYVVKKVWLENYAIPKVQLTEVSYRTGVALPEEALPGNAHNFDIILGKERKRPFALLRIPAFAYQDGLIKELSSVTVEVSEDEIAKQPAVAAKTTALPSVLASGAWYKVAVTNTGLFKIDYDFITQKLGVSPSSITPANIRVYGNGGRMLSEDNAISRKTTIEETAIWVNDGGDGSFGPGDYFVFYGIGPTAWAIDSSTGSFRHLKNLYDDKAYYFVNFDTGPGKRIGAQQENPQANVTTSTANGYALYENDLFNPGKFGKSWYGEEFGIDGGKQSTREIELEIGPVVEASFNVQLASRCPATTNIFDVWLDNQQLGSAQLSASFRTDDDAPVALAGVNWSGAYTNSKPKVKLAYSPGAGNCTGYLDYVEVNTKRALYFDSEEFTFRDWRSVKAGNIVSYQISNASAATQVWDVTDPHTPVRMNGVLNGNTYAFAQTADVLREFAAMKGSGLALPEYIGTVPNQNLVGSDAVDYIIVTHPDFLNSANELAEFHRQRSGLRVLVATTQQVYNEFSSGGQDISAIRDFARYFYERAGSDSTQMPRYLLLMGDASYDYKNRVNNNTNFVPTFESAQSLNFINSFLNDDFFAMLDDNENIESFKVANTLDVGVGRLPVKTRDEANTVVKKIINYKSAASLGPWRLSTTLIADDEDNAGAHMTHAEIMDTIIVKNSDIYNHTKVYQDAIPMISTPGGKRAPNANKAINDQVFKGTLLLNYSGHGNTQVLSHERILTQDDYNKWKNIDKLPFMVTATCDFGRFDHPEYVSAGERLVLKNDGGVIAMVVTTQLVYAYANLIINREYLDAQFQHINGRWNTFGDAFRIGKNVVYGDAATSGDIIVNFRKFVLLGDPALEPNFPEFFINTESVLDGVTMQPVDSIGALGSYIIKGNVADVNKNVLEGFNGRLSLTFFDKPRTVSVTTEHAEKKFQVRNNIIYKGKATVTNGRFSIAFIAPKDINYEYGQGKISLYAENGKTDAAGSDTSFVVGGFSDNPVIEFNPPIVRPYIGDSLFRNGGLTGQNTLLYVILEDETGINVSGNSVGHDLTAVLDGDINNPLVMNDYYETAPNTYKRGYVNFPLAGLRDGLHRITVKAWDVNNNSGEGYVDFEVADGKIVKVQNLVNYPNPFRDVTHFRFEHNHPDELMDAELNIYTSNGVLVKTLRQNFTPTGSHANEITWDGHSDTGVMLPSGVYIYRMKISTAQSVETTAYQKLVIVR